MKELFNGTGEITVLKWVTMSLVLHVLLLRAHIDAKTRVLYQHPNRHPQRKERTPEVKIFPPHYPPLLPPPIMSSFYILPVYL